MNIKLGIAPIAWSNDDMPELGGDTPIETCLTETVEAGFSGIELGGKFPRNPGIIKFLLNRFNLKMPGGTSVKEVTDSQYNQYFYGTGYDAKSIALQERFQKLANIIK